MIRKSNLTSLNNQLVSELSFYLAMNSEELEGYELIDNSLPKNTNNYLQKDLVLSFLESPATKVKICLDKGKKFEQNAVLIAHNSISKETIVIKGLADHCIALAIMVNQAQETVKQLENDPTSPIISNQFICDLNGYLFRIRAGLDEPGIGKYRYKLYDGSFAEVQFGKMVNGNREYVGCVRLETSRNKNVYTKMRELVDWTNTVAFTENRDMLLDIAEFHARFLKIHPFRDGNGRTIRLLTNYLLLINNMPIVNITDNVKDEYNLALNYANATTEEAFINEGGLYKEYWEKIFSMQGKRTEENKYVPLKNLLERCFVKENNHQLIRRMLNYNGKEQIEASQVMPTGDYVL